MSKEEEDKDKKKPINNQSYVDVIRIKKSGIALDFGNEAFKSGGKKKFKKRPVLSSSKRKGKPWRDPRRKIGKSFKPRKGKSKFKSTKSSRARKNFSKIVRNMRKRKRGWMPKTRDKCGSLREYFIDAGFGKLEKVAKEEENSKEVKEEEIVIVKEEKKKSVGKQVKLSVIWGNITKDKSSECIVNAANGTLTHIGGVAGAVLSAGGFSIQRESKEFMEQYRKNTGRKRLQDGDVAVTSGGKIKWAKYILHAVGPIYKNGKGGEAEALELCVMNTLKKAEILGIKKLSIPSISSGIFRFPKKHATEIIARSVMKYIFTQKETCLENVRFTNIDKESSQLFVLVLDNFSEYYKGIEAVPEKTEEEIFIQEKPKPKKNLKKDDDEKDGKKGDDEEKDGKKGDDEKEKEEVKNVVVENDDEEEEEGDDDLGERRKSI